MKKTKYYVEMTDTYGGEANYCWVNRFVVKASSSTGAIRKVAKHTGFTGRLKKVMDCGDMTRHDVKGAAICFLLATPTSSIPEPTTKRFKQRLNTMFTLSEIRKHYETTGNHLAAVTGLRAYQGFTWIDALNTVKQWRHERKCALRSLEESKRLAALAIRAAKNRKIWGDYATNRFIKKNNIPARVQTLAYKLEIQKQLIEKQEAASVGRFIKNGKYIGLLLERMA